MFLTNTTTTYSDIPPDCKLLGTGLSGKVRSNITFNFTTEKTFWIGARVTFQRKLNPLGRFCVQMLYEGRHKILLKR